MTLMGEALRSKDLKTVVDVLVQTDGATQINESCQTEQMKGIDFEVQVNLQPDKNTMVTQTIKQENQEIAMPNRPSSSNSKPPKKRKLPSSPQNHIENTPDNSSPIASVGRSKA